MYQWSIAAAQCCHVIEVSHNLSYTSTPPRKSSTHALYDNFTPKQLHTSMVSSASEQLLFGTLIQYVPLLAGPVQLLLKTWSISLHEAPLSGSSLQCIYNYVIVCIYCDGIYCDGVLLYCEYTIELAMYVSTISHTILQVHGEPSSSIYYPYNPQLYLCKDAYIPL